MENNRWKIEEYTADIQHYGDETGWFASQIKIHRDRMVYFSMLRKKSAFYAIVYKTLLETGGSNG